MKVPLSLQISQGKSLYKIYSTRKTNGGRVHFVIVLERGRKREDGLSHCVYIQESEGERKVELGYKAPSLPPVDHFLRWSSAS